MQTSRLEQTQDLRLTQHINPQQVALGRLLGMSAPEFEEEVRKELDENPALAMAETVPEEDFGESAEQLQLADYGNEDDVPVYIKTINNRGADDRHFDATSIATDDAISMLDVLNERLEDETGLTAEERLAADYIIGNIDSNGYLTRDLSAISADMALSEGFMPAIETMTKAYEAVLALDPPGIGAMNLRDCLLIQLDRRDDSDNPMVMMAREIVDKHFDSFANHRYDKLRTEMNVKLEDLTAALDLIKTLNPRPGSVFGGGSASDRLSQITPDFILEYDREYNRFHLSMGDNIPELTIEESFRADLPEGEVFRASRDEAREYIRSRREAANNFISLAKQRMATLTIIGKAIIDLQKTFFITGDIADLKPMILRDVSDITGYSQSTISRGISGKYMQTPHGIVQMKKLFHEGSGKDSTSAGPAIEKALLELVESENKAKPLTDDRLTKLLAEQGHVLARRTVAKYRERLGIPTARLRRQIQNI